MMYLYLPLWPTQRPGVAKWATPQKSRAARGSQSSSFAVSSFRSADFPWPVRTVPMYPGTFAATTPDRPAVVMAASGEVVTYRQLDERSNRFAHYLRSLPLGPAD